MGLGITSECMLRTEERRQEGKGTLFSKVGRPTKLHAWLGKQQRTGVLEREIAQPHEWDKYSSCLFNIAPSLGTLP